MTVENATYIGELDPSNPAGSSSLGESDDHKRLIKGALVNTFIGKEGDRWDTSIGIGPRELESIVNAFAPEAGVTLEGAQTINGQKTFTTPIIAPAGIDHSAGSLLIGNDGTATQVGNTQHGAQIFTNSRTGLKHVSQVGASIQTNTVLDTGNFVSEVINILFPVGTVLFSANSSSPASRFPGTTWAQTAQGKFIVGDGLGTDVDGEQRRYTTGQDDAFGTYRTHLEEDEMPAHSHGLIGSSGGDTSSFGLRDGAVGNQSGVSGVIANSPNGYQYRNRSNTPFVESVGLGRPHENSPPGHTLFVWQRTG